MYFIFLALLTAVIFFSYEIYFSARFKNINSRFVWSIVLLLFQIITSEYILGWLSLLNGLNLAAFNLLITVFILFATYKIPDLKKEISIIADSRNIISGYRDNVKSFIKRIKSDKFLLAISILVGLTLIWITTLGIMFPPTDYDGNSYHMTFIGNIIQNSSILDKPTSIPWLNGYPKSGELLQLWTVIFTKNDLIADMIQIPFLMLGIFALYKISLRFGAKKQTALLSSFLLLFTPIVLNQLKTTYVDVTVPCLFFLGLYFAQKDTKGPKELPLGIVSAVLLSLKPTGILFVFFILLYYLIENGKELLQNIRKSFIKIAIISLPIIFIGTTWYLKNIYYYNTPLYPFGFRIFGFQLFKGKTFQELAQGAYSAMDNLPNNYFARIWYTWTEQKDWWGCFYNYDANFTGMGPIWFILLFPAFIFSFLYNLVKRNWRMITIYSIFIALFLIYPANFYSRYVIFIVGAGIIAFSTILSKCDLVIKKIILSISLILIAVTLITNITLCYYPPKIIWEQSKINFFSNDRGVSFKNQIGQAYVFIQNRLAPNDIVIYDSNPDFIYALWRKDYKNKVYYIQANNENEWFAKAQELKAKYLFTSKGSKENNWAENGLSLRKIYEDDMRAIYEIE